jgi:hypothetical protein
MKIAWATCTCDVMREFIVQGMLVKTHPELILRKTEIGLELGF